MRMADIEFVGKRFNEDASVCLAHQLIQGVTNSRSQPEPTERITQVLYYLSGL
jgi:hypothetical protein